MAKFKLELKGKNGVTVNYGVDRALGFFCEVIKHKRTRMIEYDALVPGYDGLNGLIKLLVTEGVLAQDDATEAFLTLPHLEAKDIKDEGVRRAAEIIENLKTAASD